MQGLDLNLLRTFVLLHDTRAVTRTAERLFVTQPTVSHALGRLRRHFGDDLFTPTPAGMVPTQTADRLYPKLREALELIDETIGNAEVFDPDTTQRRFRICVTDLGELTLLPDILAAVESAAPHCVVEAESLDMAQVVRRLRLHEIDMAICTPNLDFSYLRRDPLFVCRYVGLCAADHSRISAAPTLEAYLAERHIAVDEAAGHVEVEAAIERAGHRRDIALRVPHFAALPELVSRSKYLSIVPDEDANRLVGGHAVRQFELPFAVPGVEVALYTPRRTILSPPLEWMRELVVKTIRSNWGDRHT